MNIYICSTYYVKHFNSSNVLQIWYFYSYVTHDKTEKYRNNLLYHGLLEVFRIWYWFLFFLLCLLLIRGWLQVLFSFNLCVINIIIRSGWNHSLSLSTFLPWPKIGVSALLEKNGFDASQCSSLTDPQVRSRDYLISDFERRNPAPLDSPFSQNGLYLWPQVLLNIW